MCLSTNYSSSWFGPTAHIRLYLDIVIGSTKPNADHDRSHVSVLASRLRDLNIKIEDIRREQQYQREREADFRDLSETTNSRAVWYSIAQIVVLLSTCAWQLRHLRVSTIAILYPVSNVNGNSLAILRGSEDALAYSCIPSICSKYIIRLPFAGIVLFVVSLDPEDHFFLGAARRHSPENLINCTRGFFVVGFFFNSDDLVPRLLKLIEHKS